jgi:hypothetical protein
LSDNFCYHKTKAPLKALASAFVEQAKTVGEGWLDLGRFIFNLFKNCRNLHWSKFSDSVTLSQNKASFQLDLIKRNSITALLLSANH